MAWDFSTDPAFQEQLDWMAQFVRDEIWPLETLVEELDQTALDRIYEPLQQRVKERRLWAAHLDPELGGQGFGQLKLGLMHEVLGTSPFAPNAFGCQAPDSGNSEILALAGTTEQKDRWLHPLLAGDLKSAFSMTEPDSPGSDPTQLKTRAVRDGDGKAEIATAGGAGAGPVVTIFRATGARVARLRPKGLRARRGLSLAMGDLNGDKLADFALGGDGQVVALGADGSRLGAFRPFGAGARGHGLRVAIADVNADGTPEIAVARVRHGGRLRAFTVGTWKRVGSLLGGHPPLGAVYLG